MTRLNGLTNPVPSPLSLHLNKYFEVTQDASPAFSGRAEIGQQLQAGCLPASTSPRWTQQKRYVICAMGVAGKTQVCFKSPKTIANSE